MRNFKKQKSNYSFTMAEILISLTIIGIVASITLNSLRANINEKAWATQRKTLHNRMTQAIAMLPHINGYGDDYVGTWNNNSVSVTRDNAAHAFVNEGLSKVLKINNICSVQVNTSSEDARKEFKKCGISTKYTTFGNKKRDMPTKLSELNFMFTQYYSNSNSSYTSAELNAWLNPLKHVDTRAVAFETANGESVLAFYLPYCMYGKTRADATSVIKDYVSAQGYKDSFNTPETSILSLNVMCANFIYDLNGTKGPNKIFKDMGFISVFYPTDSEVVAPVYAKTNAKNPNNPSSFTMTHDLTARACNKQDFNSRVPTVEELSSLCINMAAFDGDASLAGYAYWSSTLLTSDYAYVLYGSGSAYPTRISTTGNDKTTFAVRCVKK